MPVPAERVLARDGIGYGQHFLNGRRIALVCSALGKLEALFEAMVADLAARRRQGMPVTAMQSVQAGLGRCWVALETIRAVVDRMLRPAPGGQDGLASQTWDPTVAAAKYAVVEQMGTVLRTAQHLLGGAWYLDESPFGRWMRDVQGIIPLAGSPGVLEVDLGLWASATARTAAAPRLVTRASA